MHRRRILTAGIALVMLAGTFSGSGVAAAGPEPARHGRTITLITGDQVRLQSDANGQTAVAVQPGAGREHIGFARSAHGDDVFVVPLDAHKALTSGRLDPRLFNVKELERQGFAERGGTVPVIVSYAPGAAARTAAPARAASATRALPSINGAAMKPGADFWNWLSGGNRAFAGIDKVWLDGVSKPTLDASVPQIGAPAAWQAGYTGAGVTVAVVDTGIKADHPDLAGKVVEARDFTDSLPDGGDDVGHGTHVAGIIAGSGAASKGKYKGVAPDAKLLDAKVCLLWGCLDSAIIAGMEWAAPKARVVNMSLGGGGTDGTDPMSQALNNLTAQHGTLFVVSAGNDGQFGRVSSPASADAALAVGSVTKQDATSDFSSRGPRVGDFAVKPDIAAPGSDIASTRAAGTPVGDLDPVDDNYHRLSGTSMAAPHLAGAAALVAQQHAGWTAGQIKPALMSTAKPTADIFDQGAGRVDVARAVTQKVTSTSGSASFGKFLWPHDEPPAAKTVTYRNDGAAPATLDLALTAAGPFTLSATQLTVPANGTASVDVVATVAGTAPGQYGGRLTATADGITVQTAVAAYFEEERFDLTTTLIGRNGPGKFEDAFHMFVNSVTGEAYFGNEFPFDEAGVSRARLPRGRYDVNVFDLANDFADRTLVTRTNIDLAESGAAVTLDARKGKLVTAIVDKPDAKRQFIELGAASGANGTGGVLGMVNQADARFYAVPSGAPVTDHLFGMFFGTMLAAQHPSNDPSGYVYNLAFWERGRIPVDTTYEAPNSTLATVDSRYHAQGARTDWTIRGNVPRYPDFGPGSYLFLIVDQQPPSRRTEYYSAHPDITWSNVYLTSTQESPDVETHRSIRSYRPGRYALSWNRAPIGPAFGSPIQRYGVVRDGKQLHVAVPLFSGSDPNLYTEPSAVVTGTTTLSRDGTVLGTSGQPGAGDFDIPDTPGTYTLRTVADREAPWSVVGTSADVTWTFRDPGASAPARPLPLTVVRAVGEVDGEGRAPSGVTYPLGLVAQRQPGAPGGQLAALKVEASFNDGKAWSAVPTRQIGDGGLAVLQHPAGKGFVSLRITARDNAGNTVTQTVIRAYEIAPR